MQYQKLDVKIPIKEPKDGLLEVVKILRPSWTQEDIQEIKLLSGGFINKMYGIYLKSDVNKDDGLVIRVNSDVTIAFGGDRETELRTLLALNSKGLGVPVIASLQNGIVFKFVKGQTLSDEQMRDKRIMSMVAIELAKMHGNLPLETDPRADPFNPTGVVFNNVPETLKDPEKQSKYAANIPYAELASEFSSLKKHLLDHEMELAICHGDLWQGNIMYDQDQDTLTFIDYEQCGYQFAAFDIAFYLVTSVAGTPPDFKYYPNHEQRTHFIQHYLKEKLKITTKETCEEESFEGRYKRLYVQVSKCELLALLHLADMCLYNETILDDLLVTEFDYVRMATDCWNEYKKRKVEHLKMTPEDVSI